METGNVSGPVSSWGSRDSRRIQEDFKCWGIQTNRNGGGRVGGKLEGMWDIRNNVGSSGPGSGAECYVPPKRKACLEVPGAEIQEVQTKLELRWNVIDGK